MKTSKLWVPWAIAIACLLLLSHPFAPTWYDENYARWLFIDRGPAVILTSYDRPNNHILYSLSQWFWQWLFGKDLLINRLYPLLGAILACAGVYIAGRALFNRQAGMYSVLFFATSHVVGSFSAQLRGYGLSLGLIAIALGCGAIWLKSDFRKNRAAIGYASTGALAIGVIPTNALFVGAIACWLLLDGTVWQRTERLRIVGILMLPLLGISVYLGAWGDFIGVLTGSDWFPRDKFYTHLLRDIFGYDMPWALPLLAAGVWSAGETPHRRTILILLGCTLAPLVVPLISSVPWPRNYLPMVVFLVVLMGMSLASTLDRMGTTQITRATALAVVLILVATGFREAILHSFEPYRWAHEDERPNTLIDQYFHHASYNPDEITRLLSRPLADAAVVVPANVYWDIADLFRGEGRLGASMLCVIYRNVPDCRILNGRRASVRIRRVFFVHWDPEQVRQMADVLSRHDLGNWSDIATLPVIQDSQFKIWEGKLDLILVRP